MTRFNNVWHKQYTTHQTVEAISRKQKAEDLISPALFITAP
jgi:hypothetical protein